MQKNINLIISETNHKKRIDQALAEYIPDVSRGRIQKWIIQGDIKLNNQATNNKQKVYLGDQIQGLITEEEEIENKAENIPLDILYQDEQVVVINKSAGLVTHPGAGNPDGTLLNALLYHFPELSIIPRAGIVHRLDKDTSGVMVVARTLEAQFSLVKQLQSRTVKREYIALVNGELIGGGTVNKPIGRSKKDRVKMAVVENGKEAITHYRVLKKYIGTTLIKCQLETGRTHQIRVHLAHHKNPLIGDKLYNNINTLPKIIPKPAQEKLLTFPRQALHALKIEFIHPTSNKKVSFKTKLVADMEVLVEDLPEKDY